MISGRALTGMSIRWRHGRNKAGIGLIRAVQCLSMHSLPWSHCPGASHLWQVVAFASSPPLGCSMTLAEAGQVAQQGVMWRVVTNQKILPTLSGYDNATTGIDRIWQTGE